MSQIELGLLFIGRNVWNTMYVCEYFTLLQICYMLYKFLSALYMKLDISLQNVRTCLYIPVYLPCRVLIFWDFFCQRFCYVLGINLWCRVSFEILCVSVSISRLTFVSGHIIDISYSIKLRNEHNTNEHFDAQEDTY